METLRHIEAAVLPHLVHAVECACATSPSDAGLRSLVEAQRSLLDLEGKISTLSKFERAAPLRALVLGSFVANVTGPFKEGLQALFEYVIKERIEVLAAQRPHSPRTDLLSDAFSILVYLGIPFCAEAGAHISQILVAAAAAHTDTLLATPEGEYTRDLWQHWVHRVFTPLVSAVLFVSPWLRVMLGRVLVRALLARAPDAASAWPASRPWAEELRDLLGDELPARLAQAQTPDLTAALSTRAAVALVRPLTHFRNEHRSPRRQFVSRITAAREVARHFRDRFLALHIPASAMCEAYVSLTEFLHTAGLSTNAAAVAFARHVAARPDLHAVAEYAVAREWLRRGRAWDTVRGPAELGEIDKDISFVADRYLREGAPPHKLPCAPTEIAFRPPGEPPRADPDEALRWRPDDPASAPLPAPLAGALSAAPHTLLALLPGGAAETSATLLLLRDAWEAEKRGELAAQLEQLCARAEATQLDQPACIAAGLRDTCDTYRTAVCGASGIVLPAGAYAGECWMGDWFVDGDEACAAAATRPAELPGVAQFRAAAPPPAHGGARVRAKGAPPPCDFFMEAPEPIAARVNDFVSAWERLHPRRSVFPSAHLSEVSLDIEIGGSTQRDVACSLLEASVLLTCANMAPELSLEDLLDELAIEPCTFSLLLIADALAKWEGIGALRLASDGTISVSE
eukprot:gnl/Chilomastix_cuspidata/4918.p1 GENE.gnl/Chilomastix_cuspidata/4918~~gnl/Chilomastix_cuspidata/4918.p1  ORF type:complete len:696 (+),score=183.72 gnl/Chilomastix_cuspidata/4918:31-2088(+)